ncbi:glycosyltransferase family 2 protein [Candidatus Shapirobacteria bacterium]|nr:glycosyltransferase family 2 protein [Candidatus Shapirobacteria bacterium]
MTKSPILSVVILYYNSGHYLEQCLDTLNKSDLKNYRIETIIVNNGATDNIVKNLEKKYPHLPNINPKFVYSPTNLGFSGGNNFGLKFISTNTKYILFCNDDMEFFPDTISQMIDFMESDNNVDAATGYVTLASTGKLANETHRGFPTPWNTFWHFFGLGIPKLFPQTKLFHGYLGDYKEYKEVQQLECCQGCFLMVKKLVGETIGWWSEKYFFLGEDLDFCYQLKKHNFKLFFNPSAKIIHYHGVSSGLQKTKSTATRASKVRSALASTAAMRTFYEQNLMSDYPVVLHPVINLGITLLQVYRVFKAKYL